MKSNEEDFLLLLDHNGELALFFTHVVDHFLILWTALGAHQILTLLFEFTHTYNIAFDLVINDSHRRVTNLVY